MFNLISSASAENPEQVSFAPEGAVVDTIVYGSGFEIILANSSNGSRGVHTNYESGCL